MRILVAEDDESIRKYLVQGLREASYAVDAVADGEEALLAALSYEYDLLILDIGLPAKDGLEVCRQVRQAGRRPAILMLTARDGVPDRIAGLDAGADDYLVKPFAFGELLARTRALLRRGGGESPIIQVGDLSLDPSSRRVLRDGEAVVLTNKEFMLLEYLMRNPGRVVTKSMISEHVWDSDLSGETNYIEVYIYTLRKKIDIAGRDSLIETLRGAGYRIKSTVAGARQEC